LRARSVPAGLTAMQALDRVADVKTRYGGRFVQGIDGLEGSAGAQRDWFYFINGYEADRSAAEYRLHAGDVEWWDYRSWRSSGEARVVVGAFPEPFLHGYGGKRRPVYVRWFVRTDAAAAHRLARRLHGRSVPWAFAVPHEANVLEVKPSGLGAAGTFAGAPRFDGAGAGDPVRFTFRGDVRALARDFRLARFRFDGLR
jgi:Domain of unknown function (DUF4430)